MQVSMIGLGKLGMPCAEAMSEKHTVLGYDVSTLTSEKVQIKPTIKEAIENSEIVFIAVPTPHDQMYDGRTPISKLPTKDFNYSIAKEVLQEVDKYAKPDQDVVLISTVLPGTIRREFAPLIKNINLIYNPYFIAMGTVGDDFLNPEFFIVGTDDGDLKRTDRVVSFYKSIIPNLITRLGTWEEAECVKIFYNTFISFKLSFVNMIQDVSMKLGNIDVDFVTESLCHGKKRIISEMYMRAGMGDGGPCHPRDNIALRDLAERMDLGYDLYSAIMVSREVQAENLAKFLLSFNKSITIVGKSFKPGVPFVDGSYSLLVGHFTSEHGGTVEYWDPLIESAKFEPTEPQTYLLGHDNKDFYSHPFVEGSTIVDPWRKCPEIAGCKVVHFGNTRGIFPEL